MPAPSIVQSTLIDGGISAGPGAQTTPNFTSAQSAGDAIYVFIAADTGTTAAPSGATPVQDTKGNSYTLVAHLAPTGTTCGVWVYACQSIVASAANANAVTTNWGAGTINFGETYAVQITGGGGGVDAATIAIATGNSGLASAGPVTTGAANELMLGYCFNDNTASGAGTGWTLDTNSVTGFGAALERQTQASSGASVTATTPISSAAAWVQAVLGIEPPTSVAVTNITSH